MEEMGAGSLLISGWHVEDQLVESIVYPCPETFIRMCMGFVIVEHRGGRDWKGV